MAKAGPPTRRYGRPSQAGDMGLADCLSDALYSMLLLPGCRASRRGPLLFSAEAPCRERRKFTRAGAWVGPGLTPAFSGLPPRIIGSGWQSVLRWRQLLPLSLPQHRKPRP